MGAQLDIGRTLERVLAVYRAQAAVLIPVAALVFIPAALLQALVQDGLDYGIFASLFASAIGLVATLLYQGMVVEAVRDIQDGRRDFGVGDLVRSVLPVLLPLIAASLLFGLGVGLGFLLLIVPGLILLTLWALLAPVIVIERAGVFDAFGRSQRLVRDSAFQVFAVILVIFLIQILALILSLALIVALGPVLGYLIASLIANVLLAPVAAIAATVMYLELRGARGEGPVSAAGPPGVPAGDTAPAPRPEAAPQPPPSTPPSGPQSPPDDAGGQPTDEPSSPPRQ